MRTSLRNKKLNRFLLAALAAGTLSVSAVSAQTNSSTTAKKPAPKTSHANTSHASTSHASTAHSGTTHKASTTHSSSTTTHSGVSTKSTKATSSKRKSRTKKVKGQAAPTTDRINEIQAALAKKGTFNGTPTGTWDDSTVDAMKKFQSSNHLNPTGKLDALTLQKLGLGSETAGLAAPIPPPNSANRLLGNTSNAIPEPSN